MVSCGGNDSVDEASFGGVDGLVSKQTSVFYRLSKGNINSLISSSFITSCLSSDLDVVSLSLTSRTFGKNMGSFAPWYLDISVDTVH